MSDVRSGRGSTDVSIDEGEVRRGGKACLGNAARSCDHAIAATEKGLDHGCSDALGGASYDDCLVARHTYTPLFRARPSTDAARSQFPTTTAPASLVNLRCEFGMTRPQLSAV